MFLRGKIAQILDDTRVVLNIGSKQGVKIKQVFLIFQEGDDVVDPDTKTSLGKIEIPKGKIIIENVQEQISIGATEVKARDNDTKKTLSELMVEASTPQKSDREKLLVDRFQIKPLPTITPVKIGDWVRSLTE